MRSAISLEADGGGKFRRVTSDTPRSVPPMPRGAAPTAIIWRGLTGRCGRCGSRGIFASWFRLRERCPRCGYRFEREEGAFTGVWLVNYAFGLLPFLALITWLILTLAAGDDVAVLPLVLAAAALALVMPVVTYPLAKSTWAALDLAMRPLDPVEEAEAALHATDEGEDQPR